MSEETRVDRSDDIETEVDQDAEPSMSPDSASLAPSDADDTSSIDATQVEEPTETAAEDTTDEVTTPLEAGDGKRKRRRRRRRKRSTPTTTRDTEASSETSPSVADGTTSAAEDLAGETSDGDQKSQESQESPAETTGEPVSLERAAPRPVPQSRPKVEVVAPPSGSAHRDSQSTSQVERNYVFSFPERNPAEERKLALFCDFENIALGVRASEVKKLDINLILARLLEKGKIIVKRAYADWERYNEYKRPLHEAAIELIDIPQKYYSGKNSADIKLVVDAMDLCYSKEHLDTFVILSGDSDFSPLVSKLKENNKVVIGVGIKDSSSGLLVENCDEFVFYEDIWKAAQKRPTLDDLPPQKAEVFGLMADAMLALLRENKEILWGSLVKQTMQRKSPSFNEEFYGYGSFSEMLEDAERHKIIGLRRDQRSGNYVVTGFVN